MRALTLFLISTSCFAGYSSKATVTFAAASGSSTDTNITLAFSGSDTKLKLAANGGQITHTVTRAGVTVPADFVLTTDSACVTISGYNWGIEFYDGVGGTIKGWVKIPSLTTGASVIPVVCVGNNAITTYQGGALGAEYDASTQSVYHLPDGTTLSGKDFSSNANDGTVTSVTALAGQIDGAGSFNGTSSVIIGSTLTLNTANATVSGWVKIASNPASSGQIAGFANGNVASVSDKTLFIDSSGKARFLVYDGANKTTSVPASGITTGAWHYLAGTTNSTTAIAYADGVSQGTIAAGASYTGYSQANLLMGGSVANGVVYLAASIDEVKFANTARTADWILTEYNNQNSPPSISAFTALAKPAPDFVF